MNRRIRHEVFDECRARFVSEYGIIGPCHWIRSANTSGPDEIERGHARVEACIRTRSREDTVPAAIRYHYADPEKLTMPEYVLYGQCSRRIFTNTRWRRCGSARTIRCTTARER